MDLIRKWWIKEPFYDKIGAEEEMKKDLDPKEYAMFRVLIPGAGECYGLNKDEAETYVKEVTGLQLT
ncbi:MAG: hypothetical protein IKE58_02470 [Blautia sp.]|nr:hypothetical protein [Blautia sp.]